MPWQIQAGPFKSNPVESYQFKSMLSCEKNVTSMMINFLDCTSPKGTASKNISCPHIFMQIVF